MPLICKSVYNDSWVQWISFQQEESCRRAWNGTIYQNGTMVRIQLFPEGRSFLHLEHFENTRFQLRNLRTTYCVFVSVFHSLHWSFCPSSPHRFRSIMQFNLPILRIGLYVVLVSEGADGLKMWAERNVP